MDMITSLVNLAGALTQTDTYLPDNIREALDQVKAEFNFKVTATPKCPKCGAKADNGGNTLQVLLASCDVAHVEKGDGGYAVEYNDYTEVDWNSQETMKDLQGNTIFQCSCGAAYACKARE